MKRAVLLLLFIALYPLYASGGESTCIEETGLDVVVLDRPLFDLIGITSKITTQNLNNEGLERLLDFIELSSALIERGFVYDSKAAENALYNFTQDYKRISKNHKFTDEELLQFFSETEIAQIISKGIASSFMTELILTTFTGSLHVFEGEDKAGIRELADQLSSPEYFNIFVSSKEGKRLIDDVKNKILLPSLTKSKIEDVSDRINRDIALTVFTDVKDYGVSERFTALYYSAELEKKNHSYQTKMMILTGGLTSRDDYVRPIEYDWNKLRQTTSGRRAIEQFGRKIIAQALAQSEISDEEIIETKKNLDELLKKAMDEVDDV
ncbi:MAG: hypothetical protein KAG61_08125 [Bacteriovoracaceae bacterium]|nr:hypothetical protein [Bacteriovoracaceae bacterium]